MAASPSSILLTSDSNVRPNVQRRSLALTQRRLEANRRNAARSTGPRTPQGKARVARNPIKHSFFVAQQRWTPRQHRDYEKTLAGLRDDFQPQGILEEECVAAIAESYVRKAAVLRWENLAALKYHQQQDRELNRRIAAADPAEAARLEAERDQLHRAGLWVPILPSPREAMAIIRYEGRLDRTIRHATSALEELKKMRLGAGLSDRKAQKQTHFSAPPRRGPEAAEGPRMAASAAPKTQKQTHFATSPRSGPGTSEGPQMTPFATLENARTNPLTSMFTGNRHARRRAKALAARSRWGGAEVPVGRD